MERTLRKGTMLEVEVQMDELEQITKRPPQEEPTADMDVVALHTELPPRSTCTATKTATGEITRKDLKGDCRN
eukprot:15857504-Heterocapsa_arctica.AAC.1